MRTGEIVSVDNNPLYTQYTVTLDSDYQFVLVCYGGLSVSSQTLPTITNGTFTQLAIARGTSAGAGYTNRQVRTFIAYNSKSGDVITIPATSVSGGNACSIFGVK